MNKGKIHCPRILVDINTNWKLIQDLATLVDGAYDIVETHKVETNYQMLWRKNWLENAKKAIDKVVEMQNDKAITDKKGMKQGFLPEYIYNTRGIPNPKYYEFVKEENESYKSYKLKEEYINFQFKEEVKDDMIWLMN